MPPNATPPAAAKFRIITEQREWDAVARDLARVPRLALDMESNGFFHYKERISLLQLSGGAETILLDPLAVRDLAALGAILSDPGVTKILHGCDYDLRSFDREYGYHFAGLVDTAVATQLLNPELMGLGRAIETYLGITLTKQVRLQRSDWSHRPIPADALEYAAGDVAHLHALHDVLDAKLRSLGREAWMAEECALMERIRYEAPPPPEEALFGAKGTFDLDPRALAIFKELYLVREQDAAKYDRPSFKIISSEALLAIARDPGLRPDQVPNANRRWLQERFRDLAEAVRRGRAAEPLQHPSRGRRRPSPWTEEGRARWRAVSEVRAARAAELGIAPATLWPTRSLEQMCIDPALFEDETAGTSRLGVRRWQREVLADAIRTAWTGSGAG